MQDPTPEGISGVEALRRTEAWWTQQRKRGPSADVTWTTAYAGPLKPLLLQGAGTLVTFRALVASKPVGSCSRRKQERDIPSPLRGGQGAAKPWQGVGNPGRLLLASPPALGMEPLAGGPALSR